MSATKQELLSLKEDNLRLKENFKTFLKKHESNKKYITKEKVKEFMEHQEILIENLNKKIENMIVKDENRCQKTRTAGAISQKRRKSEIGGTNKAYKRSRKDPVSVKNYFENIIKSPGLQHLAEEIFSHLNFDDLQTCQLINRSCKSILDLDNPMFWLKKFIQKGISKQNEMDWSKAIQLSKRTQIMKKALLCI